MPMRSLIIALLTLLSIFLIGPYANASEANQHRYQIATACYGDSRQCIPGASEYHGFEGNVLSSTKVAARSKLGQKSAFCAPSGRGGKPCSCRTDGTHCQGICRGGFCCDPSDSNCGP
jgi:hypothetical protein